MTSPQGVSIQVHAERHDDDLVSVVHDCLEELGGIGPHLWDSLTPEMKSLFKAKTYDGRTDACSFVAVVNDIGGDRSAIAHAYVFPCEELKGDIALGIHVMRPYQRMKIGHALIRRVQEWVVANKHVTIRMTTLKTNLRSQAFFASMGFEVENHYGWKDGKMTKQDTGPHVYMRWTAPVPKPAEGLESPTTTCRATEPAEGLSPTASLPVSPTSDASPPTTSKCASD